MFNSRSDASESVTRRQPASSGQSPAPPFLSRHGAAILALVPLLFLIGVVVHYAVAVPYYDQWELVPLLEKSYRGDLALHDLWAQHNEHRIFFPLALMLPLARLTGWNVYYELALNLALALGIFLVFTGLVKRTARQLAWSGLSWSIPAVSVVVFSVCQYQNWLWGWQLQMFLNLLAVVGGIGLLAGDTFRWRRFAGAALLGVVANYSFANGILFWPIGLAVLFVVTRGTRDSRPTLIAWLLVAALALGTYFYHYQKPEEQPPLSLIFKMPLTYAAYVFKYLGGITNQGLCGDDAVDMALAGVVGLAGMLALGWSGWMLVRKRIAGFRVLVPYFALSAYSIGSALMTGVGRLGYGSDQALASRYGTMATSMWASLIVLLALLARRGAGPGQDGLPEPKPAAGFRPWDYRSVARWSLGIVIALLALGSMFAVGGAANLSQAQSYGRASLLNLAAHPEADIDYPVLALLYPSPKIVVERYPILVEHHLSVFRDPR
jgi:hypothetical protein